MNHEKMIDHLGPYEPQRAMQRKEVFDFFKGAAGVLVVLLIIFML